MKKPIVLGVSMILSIMSPAMAVSVSASQVAFNNADKNNNKSLDKREFKRYISNMASLNSASARLVIFHDAYSTGFRLIDKNSDGKITFSETRRYR